MGIYEIIALAVEVGPKAVSAVIQLVDILKEGGKLTDSQVSEIKRAAAITDAEWDDYVAGIKR